MLFGIGIALALALPWLALGRSGTYKLVVALAFIVLAGSMAAVAAEWLLAMMPHRRRSARFSAAVIVLTLGSAGLFCCLTTLLAIREHLTEGLPLHILVLIFIYAGAASLYNWLAVAGWLLLPIGLPFLVAYAALITQGSFPGYRS